MNFLDEITKNKKRTLLFHLSQYCSYLKQNAYIINFISFIFLLLIVFYFPLLTSVASVDTLSKPFISSLHPHLLFPVVDPQKSWNKIVQAYYMKWFSLCLQGTRKQVPNFVRGRHGFWEGAKSMAQLNWVSPRSVCPGSANGICSPNYS